MPVGLLVARKVGCRSITGPAPPFQSNMDVRQGSALTRSWSSDGHFRRTAGAAKLILTSVSDIPNNPGEILSRQQSFVVLLPG